MIINILIFMLLTLFIYNILILDKIIIETLSDCKEEEKQTFKAEANSDIQVNKLKKIYSDIQSMNIKSTMNNNHIKKNIVNAKELKQ